MGELVLIQQPRRRAPLPATLGILGSSKGNTYAVGSEGGGPPAPAVGPVSNAQVASVLSTLNTIANPTPPQKITATGDTLRTPEAKARGIRTPPPPPPAPAPRVYVALPYLWPGGSAPGNTPPAPPPPTGAPGPAFPGTGGGGGGGAAPSDDEAAAAATGDAPVFLGLTQTQLLVGGALAVAAFFLLRKKRPGQAAEGV